MAAAADERLGWLTDILWGGSDGPGATVERNGAAAVAVERYLILPRATRPRHLVPLASRAAGAAYLAHHGALGPLPSRLAARVLAAMVGTGLGRIAIRDRLEVPAADHAGSADTLLTRLREVFGREVAIGIRLRHPGPQRKPVLRVLSLDGEVLGFVKVGWNDITRPQIRNEVGALRRWQARRPRTFAVPALIHHGPWRGREIVVVAPLPARARRLPLRRVVALEAIHEIAGTIVAPGAALAHTSYWARLERRVEEAAEGGDARLASSLRAFAADLAERHGDREVPLGECHESWAPQNLARCGGTLWVMDWEHSRTEAPVGVDVLHYLFTVSWRHLGTGARQAARRMAARGVPLLPRLGVPPDTAEAVVGLYLLESALRWHEVVRQGGSLPSRLYPSLIHVLDGWGRPRI